MRLAVSEQFNISLPAFLGEYRTTADIEGIAALVEREAELWLPVRPSEEKLGDVIVLRLKGQPVHVGLVLGDMQMLHVEQGVDSAIEKYSSPRWKDRIHGFYRYESFDDTTAHSF